MSWQAKKYRGCTELAGVPGLRWLVRMIAGLNAWVRVRGDRSMSADLLRNRAEEYLEKARAVSDRQRAQLFLVQAHNYLKRAEETEAEQLTARR